MNQSTKQVITMCNDLSYESLSNVIDIILYHNIHAKLFTHEGKNYLGVSSDLGLVVELSGDYNLNRKLLKVEFENIKIYASCQYDYDLIEMWLQIHLADSSVTTVVGHSDVLES